MKNLFTTILAIAFCYITYGQSSYTWNVTSGDWSTSTSWSPSRTSPNALDTLIFDGSVISRDTVTNFITDSIARLLFINNVKVNFSTSNVTNGTGTVSRSGNTVTGSGTSFLTDCAFGDGFYHGTGNGISEITAVSSNTSLTTSASSTASSVTYRIYPRLIFNGVSTSFPALVVQSGSTVAFNISNPNGITFSLLTGCYASISGTINFQNGRNRIISPDSNAIRFLSGSVCQISSNYSSSSSPFGSIGNTNTVTFQQGSSYIIYNSGSHAFGLTAPQSRCWFATGSWYRYKANIALSLAQRTISNLEIDTSIFNKTTTSIVGGATIDTLRILNANTVGFSNTSTGTLNIKGSIIVNSGALSFGSSSTATQTVNLNGTQTQSIGGSGGTIYFGALSSLKTNNSNGFILNRSLQIEGPLTMTSGNINLNSDTITLGSSSTVSSLTYSSGNMIGSGMLKRWIGTNTITIGSDDGRFPLGTSNSDRSLWIGGIASSGGTVSVMHNDVNGRTAYNNPFSDNATNSITVNVRQNSNWVISNADGFSGSSFDIRVQGAAGATDVTNTTDLRITQDTNIAPGGSLDGGGTTSSPQANRTGLADTDLNNIFYIGGDSTQNPLPVKLISFKATCSDEQKVLIEWRSSSEINVDRYEIEKSFDGKNFEKLTTIKSSGNSNSIITYGAIDVNAFIHSAIVYYRLKMIDMDGHFELSSIVIVTQNVDHFINSINAFPNPTNGDIVLNIESNQSQKSKIEIIDRLGKTFYSSNQSLEIGNNNIKINMNSMETGLYIIRISNINDTKNLKVLKN